MGAADGCKERRCVRKCFKLVREKLILVREKFVKSQGISFQTKGGHADIGGFTLFVSDQ